MDSDLTRGGVGSSLDEFLRRNLGDKAYEGLSNRARQRVAEWVDAQGAKAQRRADLVTLTAAALSGALACQSDANGWHVGHQYLAQEAVSVAEAALTMIEERTK